MGSPDRVPAESALTDRLAIVIGIALAIQGGCEISGPLRPDPHAWPLLAAAVVLTTLGVASRVAESRAAVQSLIRTLVIAGFFVAGATIFGPHPSHAYVTMAICQVYVLIKMGTDVSAIVVGAFSALDGAAHIAHGASVQWLAPVDVALGLALIAAGLAPRIQPWKPHARFLATATAGFGLVVAAVVGIVNGFSGRVPPGADAALVWGLLLRQQAATDEAPRCAPADA